MTRQPKNDKSGLKADPRAEQIAGQYGYVLCRSDSGRVQGSCVELPGVVMSDADELECLRLTRRAAVIAVSFILRRGGIPPIVASSEMRTEQVNIRLTAMEKLRLEAAAENGGYRGLSDYVRAAAMKDLKSSKHPVRHRSKKAG